MRLSLYLVCISLFFFLSSCAGKLPIPNDKGKGIVVIPMKVKNDTTFNKVSHDYILSSLDRSDVINIEPRLGQKFFLSYELEPGYYEFYQVAAVFDGSIGIADQNKQFTTIFPRIDFTIKAGSISISDNAFIIHMYPTDVDRYQTKHTVEAISTDHRKELVETLKSSKNANLWDIR